MSDVFAILLITFGGFLAGGAYTARKYSKLLAVLLLVAAVLSAAGGALRLV
jgi:hypothetical protein